MLAYFVAAGPDIDSDQIFRDTKPQPLYAATSIMLLRRVSFIYIILVAMNNEFLTWRPGEAKPSCHCVYTLHM